MIPLERIREGDWPSVEHMRETLESLVIDTGGRSLGLRVGAQVLTFPGGAQSTGVEVVKHGLGKVPLAVLVSVMNPTVPAFAWTGGIGAADFSVAAATIASAPTAGTTLTIGWAAIG